jgi:hypothetical protein
MQVQDLIARGALFAVNHSGGKDSQARDLANGARHNPQLYAKYLELEVKTGFTMFHKHSLAELVAEGERLLVKRT